MQRRRFTWGILLVVAFMSQSRKTSFIPTDPVLLDDANDDDAVDAPKAMEPANPVGELGKTCIDFTELLIDHMVAGMLLRLDDPIVLDNTTTTFVELSDAKLYGLQTVKRTCDIRMEHEEVWQKADNTQPNVDIALQDWMKRRDLKLGDVLIFDFCLGVSQSLVLRSSMVVHWLWSTYGPERVALSLSNISIWAQLTLELNRTGQTALRLTGLRVERLERIVFDSEEPTESPDLAWENDETGSSNGLISNYGSLVTWLVNSPLYTPLVIILEGVLRDSFSAQLEKLQGIS